MTVELIQGFVSCFHRYDTRSSVYIEKLHVAIPCNNTRTTEFLFRLDVRSTNTHTRREFIEDSRLRVQVLHTMHFWRRCIFYLIFILFAYSHRVLKIHRYLVVLSEFSRTYFLRVAILPVRFVTIITNLNRQKEERERR